MPIFTNIWKLLKGVTQRSFWKVMGFCVILDLLFGLGFYLAESRVQPDLTLADSLWWAMVTMTTVGYGDFYAQTFVGRFFVSIPCMILGIGFIGFTIGYLTDAILERTNRKRKGKLKMKEKNHIILCNYPGEKKILNLVKEIRNHSGFSNTPIVLLDENLEELPESLILENITFYSGSPLNPEELEKCNVIDACGVIVLSTMSKPSESDAQAYTISSIVTMLEKKHGKTIRVISEVMASANLTMIQRSGADGFVTLDGLGSRLLVQEFLYPGLNDLFSQMLTNAWGSQIYLLPTRLLGFAVHELQIKALQHPSQIQIIGVFRDGKAELNPGPENKVQEKDLLIILAPSHSYFHSFEDHALQKETT